MTHFSVEQGDAVTCLRGLSDDSVDCVISDYAYESLEKHRARGTTTRLKESKKSSNPWFRVFPNRRLPELLDQICRILRPQRHAWMLCDDETADLVKTWAPIAGLYVWNTLIWFKTTPKTPPGEWGPPKIGLGYHGRRCTERIVMLEKRSVPFSGSSLGGFDLLGQPNYDGRPLPPGKGRRLNDLGMAEVLPCPSVATSSWPTEKPVWLLRRLIEQSTQPGELVVDPFCGSGSCGEAARLEGRRWIGNDIEPRYAESARRRAGLAGPADGMPLFDLVSPVPVSHVETASPSLDPINIDGPASDPGGVGSGGDA